MLVLLYMPDSPKVIIAASTITANTAFSSILLLILYHFYRNLVSKYIIK